MRVEWSRKLLQTSKSVTRQGLGYFVTDPIRRKQSPKKTLVQSPGELTNVVVTSEEVVTVQFWAYGFSFLLYSSVPALGWFLVLVGCGGSFQTVSLNTCRHVCCLSTLKTTRIYKSVTRLFWVADGTSLVSYYAYCLWWDVFITELKQLATPGLSSDAAWKTTKCTDKLKAIKVKFSMSQWVNGEDMMGLQCCGHTGITHFTVFTMSLIYRIVSQLC